MSTTKTHTFCQPPPQACGGARSGEAFLEPHTCLTLLDCLSLRAHALPTAQVLGRPVTWSQDCLGINMESRWGSSSSSKGRFPSSPRLLYTGARWAHLEGQPASLPMSELLPFKPLGTTLPPAHSPDTFLNCVSFLTAQLQVAQ